MRNYNPSSDGFRQIAVSDEVRSALAEVAEKAKGIAEGLSQDFRVTGEYAASFEVGRDTIPWAGQYPGPRAVATLTNSSPHAAAVEYGYRGRSADESSSAHRVLGRTLAQLDTE